MQRENKIGQVCAIVGAGTLLCIVSFLSMRYPQFAISICMPLVLLCLGLVLLRGI